MIPNLVYGQGISGALAYVMGQGNDAQTGARLELQSGEESRATLLGGQGFGFDIDTPERLDLARRVMEWQGLPENQGSKTRKQDLDCLHASLSWEAGQTPDAAEMRQAATEFLAAIGLEKARAIFVAHDDHDHPHMHIVASRIDPETGKTLRVDYDKAAAQKWALDWEQAHGQERTGGKDLHALREAVQARDAAAVLEHLTANASTFEPWQINRALQYGGLDGEARDAFRADILAHPSVLGLRASAEAEAVTRYTTLEVAAPERATEQSAARLAEDKRHGVASALTDKAERDFTLKPQQTEALLHLTGAEGFAILWGEAGTGKSHTLTATRAAYEASGRDVIGLSWTNAVVQQMHGDGFQNCGTVASQLYAHDKGRSGWNANTVLMVDEAAQLSTDSLLRLTRAAEVSHAKLILAGDDAQLSSIERGGMFERLRETHGAATLTEVQRVKEAEQQAAFNAMHGHKFETALKTFEERGGLHWTTRQSDALAQMAQDYAAAVAADPDKRRFMFAHTNKDVAALNEQARAIHKERGDLGDDQTLATKHGAAQFATGDRIQFTGNGYGQSARRAGLVNGRVGSVAALETGEDGKARLTVELDAKKGAPAREVSFVVGSDARAGEFDAFRHGYAGTVYKGQGKTLDETYIAHDPHMRSAAAYVALTRHRENIHLYAARESVKDLAAIAKGFERADNKRAALAYTIDPAQMARIDQAAASYTPPRQATAAKAASRKQQAEGKAEAREDAADRALFGSAKAFGSAARALAVIFNAFTGEAAPPPMTAKERHEARLRAFVQREQEQHAANSQEKARSLGASDALTPEELKREQEAQEKRSRDRGGGQSL